MSALEKLIKGEVLTEEEKNSLTPEQIAEARKKELEGIDALRLERRRLEGLKSEEEKKTVTDFSKRTLEEYTRKAEAQVFSQLQAAGIELTEEKKEAIRKMRVRLDEGSVTYENIVDDFISAAAAINKTSLFEDRNKRIEFEKNAAQYNSAQAGGMQGGTPPVGADGKAFSQEVWEMVKDAARQGLTLTPEEANNSLTRGMRRIYH